MSPKRPKSFILLAAGDPDISANKFKGEPVFIMSGVASKSLVPPSLPNQNFPKDPGVILLGVSTVILVIPGVLVTSPGVLK